MKNQKLTRREKRIRRNLTHSGELKWYNWSRIDCCAQRHETRIRSSGPSLKSINAGENPGNTIESATCNQLQRYHVSRQVRHESERKSERYLRPAWYIHHLMFRETWINLQQEAKHEKLFFVSHFPSFSSTRKKNPNARSVRALEKDKQSETETER